MTSSKQRPAEWVSDIVPGRLALRLRRELENIELEAATEGQVQQSAEAETYTWLIMVAEILEEELQKAGQENPAELVGYLPDWASRKIWPDRRRPSWTSPDDGET